MTERWCGIGRRWQLTLASLGVIGVAGGCVLLYGKALFANPAVTSAERKTVSKVNVDVVSPRAGGLERTCVQPCTLEAFDSAVVYAMVSGYLAEQSVDIGSKVRKGETIAQIWKPEYEKQVKMDTAEVLLAEAKVEQMTAGVETAAAELKAATAAVALARAEVKSKTAFREYREKERNRIVDLAKREAVQQRVADEQENYFQAAIAAELASNEAVNSAIEKEAASRATVVQSKANLKRAQAEVEVAKARLEQSQVMLDYTVIKSPYTGVVTKRHFHVGEFIGSSGPVGNRVAILEVERTDIMRMIVYVPDRDVPYVQNGNPAVVEFDALPKRPFKTIVKTAAGERVEVSRSAVSEDPHTRMMRTEVDLDNRDGKLISGLFGRVTIILSQGNATTVRIPSIALVGDAARGNAVVRVVHGDTVRFVPVQYGLDNGAEVEIVAGLSSSDRVVIRTNGPVEDGAAVTVSQADSGGQ